MEQDKKLLQNLISNAFADRQEQVYRLLIKYNLVEPIANMIVVTQSQDSEPLLSDLSFISGLSSIFLTKVNGEISKIKSQKEKEEVEYIVNELAKEILVEVIKKSKNSPREVLHHIAVGLKNACRFNNWDYDTLMRVMDFELLHTLSAKENPHTQEYKTSKKIIPAPQLCYYEWLLDPKYLDDLAYNLKDRKIIKSVREFKRLFMPHAGKLTVRFNRADIDFVIVLFEELYERKLILPRGHKSKKFTPLKLYSVDFEETVLIKNKAKHQRYAVHKKAIKLASLKKSISKWLSGYHGKV